MPRVSGVLVYWVVCCVRMCWVSRFCWCLHVEVSAAISVMPCQSVGSMLWVAVWSRVFECGSLSNSDPKVAWPVCASMKGAVYAVVDTYARLVAGVVALLEVRHIFPVQRLLWAHETKVLYSFFFSRCYAFLIRSASLALLALTAALRFANCSSRHALPFSTRYRFKTVARGDR